MHVRNGGRESVSTLYQLSYRQPRVHEVSGCDANGCGNVNTGGARITLKGTDFGESGITVMVGSNVCKDVKLQHYATPGEEHESATCIIPNGAGVVPVS